MDVVIIATNDKGEPTMVKADNTLFIKTELWNELTRIIDVKQFDAKASDPTLTVFHEPKEDGDNATQTRP